MTNPSWQWLHRDRRAFLANLAKTGDPAAAAELVGRSLPEAYRLREEVAGFAAGWARALEIAWDQVETRVLAGLLAGPPKATAAKSSDVPATLIDSRVALAVLQRREPAKSVRAVAPRVDSARVAALRNEIRALAAGAAR